MKTSCIIIFALLLVGCAGPRQGASLTVEQATTAAIQCANDKAFTLYHCQPFRSGQAAQFLAGHWVWSEQQGFGRGDIQATVELSADGAACKVEVQVLTNQNLLSFMQ